MKDGVEAFCLPFILPPSAFILAYALPHGRASALAQLHALEDDGDALAAADAGRGEAVAAAAPLQFVERRQHEARPRGAERVAERDGAAVDVGLRAVEPQLLLDGEVLAGESLVDLDEVDLRELEVRLLQGLADGGDGADAHHVG